MDASATVATLASNDLEYIGEAIAAHWINVLASQSLKRLFGTCADSCVYNPTGVLSGFERDSTSFCFLYFTISLQWCKAGEDMVYVVWAGAGVKSRRGSHAWLQGTGLKLQKGGVHQFNFEDHRIWGCHTEQEWHRFLLPFWALWFDAYVSI